MKIRPLNDHVLVERQPEETKTAGGIFIPDSATEKPQRGKVIAVGSGKVRENGERQVIDLKAGDDILFGKYSGTEIKVDGKEYLMMKESDILGVITH